MTKRSRMGWAGVPEPVLQGPRGFDWIYVILRALGLVLGTLVLIPPYALAKLIWRIGGPDLRRPFVWTWARLGCWASGVSVTTRGTPMQQGGARVINHASWLDIFTILGSGHLFFVAKEEVRGWPMMGWIAAFTGTAFIARRRTEAGRQRDMFLSRIRAGDRLGFFPEGTSSDGQRVLPFRSTLFAAFTDPELAQEMWVQPVSITYHPAPHLRPDFYGWWGETEFVEHLVEVMARSRRGTAVVVYHPPVLAAEFADRKALAAHCEAEVRKGVAERLPGLDGQAAQGSRPGTAGMLTK